jgi:hypothetical protein
LNLPESKQKIKVIYFTHKNITNAKRNQGISGDEKDEMRLKTGGVKMKY